MSFESVKIFENKIAKFFGAPYAVAVDCCTHGLELCIRYTDTKLISVPKRTYISIPFLANKIGIDLVWKDQEWKDYYHLTNKIIDAAVLWKKNSYISGTFMCISFQFRKHLSLGRGGVILCDNKEDYWNLKKMTYDGRHPDFPWMEQNINTMGYHYYMTPETAQNGLNKLDEAIKTEPKQWSINDWPDVSRMEVFNKRERFDPYLQTR
jgi:dTDP-4-amino-4,6-dideoxygalactose transaminase